MTLTTSMDAPIFPPPRESETIWTVKEVAEILKVRVETVRSEIRKGRMRAKSVGPKGGLYRIRQAWLDEYLNKR